MKQFIKLFTRNIQQNLGRWSLDYNHKIVDRKVSLANEDHCSCDYYITQKRKEKTGKKK